jgi:superfamily II DNA or RNA helicase
MTALTLRPYQREAVQAIREAWCDRGVRCQLLVLPTGAGKTVVFSHLIRRRAQSGRALVIAHTEELLRQAAEKLYMIAPELRAGVVKAQRNEHGYENDVVIGSIQTLARPKRLAPLVGTVSTVIVDEAHHAAAKTYREVLNRLGCFTDDGPLTVGVTATAGRGDGVGLDAVWQEIVYQRGIIHMIAEGFLVDVKALEVMTDLDLQRVATSHGDFTNASLGQEIANSGAIEAAAFAYRKYASDRRGIAFTPTIATAHDLADHLNSHSIPAEAVSGETPTDERRAILRRLHSGETQVVTNAMVLTEGFDEPAVSCILIARPTKSRPLFVQMAGRALRLHPGKDDALILDLFAPPDAGLATIADLAGLDPEQAPKVKPGETLVQALIREEAETEAFGRHRVATNLTVKQLNLFARSGLRWVPAGSGFTLPCGQRSLLLVPAGDDRYQVVESLRGGETRTISESQPLEWAQGIGEEYARAHGGVIARADAKWRTREVTDEQVTRLKKLRLPIPPTRGEASDALSAAYAGRTMARLAKAATATTNGNGGLNGPDQVREAATAYVADGR